MTTAPATTAPAPDRRRRLLILGICSLTLFMGTLDNTIVNVALPVLQKQFHASVSELQWVADAYLLVLAALLLLAGSLGDRYGRKRVLMVGLAVFGAGSLACSLATSLPLLIGFRMVQACGGCMLNPNSLSIISATFRDPRERAAAIGFWGGVVGISTAAGPILGGALIDAVDWRAIFWVNIPVVILAMLTLSIYVPETKSDRPRRLDPVGQVLAIAVLGALTYAIIEGPSLGWAAPSVLCCFGVAVGGSALFLLAEKQQREPLLNLRFFRSPPFSGATAIATVAFVVLAGWLFLNTLYLQEVRGYSPLLAGVAALPATIVIAGIAPLTGRLVGRRGARLPLTAAGLCLAAGSALLVAITPRTPYLYLAVAYLFIGFGFGAVNPPITNAAVSGMPLRRSGVAAAIASTARQVGSVLGVAVLGSVVSQQMRGRLAAAATRAHLSPAVKARLEKAGVGGGGIAGAGLPARAARLVGQAFTSATHAGWALAAGGGFVIAVVAFFTTGPRAAEAAARVMREAEGEAAA